MKSCSSHVLLVVAVASLATAIVLPRTSAFSFGKPLTRSFLQNAAALRASSTSASTESAATATDGEEHWMDFLKFDSCPTFDVMERTKQFTSEPGYIKFSFKDIPKDYYHEDYVFRGPVVGPMTDDDLRVANGSFNWETVYPDLRREPFGFCVDPENPYRVMWFERWSGTNTGDFKVPYSGGLTLPATGKVCKPPAHVCTINWTPEGKVIYLTLSGAVDRFEGNTKGKVAVFGLFETIGLPVSVNPGDSLFTVFQELLLKIGGPSQMLSPKQSIPSWWKTRSRGSGPNDV